MTEIQSVERIFDSTPERYEQEKFHPKFSLDSDYTPNPAEMREQMKKPLEKRIVWIQDSSDGIFSEHLIDSTIRIKTVSNAYSQHKRALWKDSQKKSLPNSNWSAFLTLLVPPLTFFAPPSRAHENKKLIAMGVFLLALAVYYRYLANDAEKQAQCWSQSPVLDAAKEREKAYQEGFSYAYSKNLKKEGGSSGVLHPLEVKTFYEEYFPQFCQAMLTKEASTPVEQLQWIGDFCKMNPISSPLLRYGLGEIPEHLKEVVQECDQFISEIKSNKIPPKDEIFKIYNRGRELILKGELAWKNRPST